MSVSAMQSCFDLFNELSPIDKHKMVLEITDKYCLADLFGAQLHMCHHCHHAEASTIGSGENVGYYFCKVDGCPVEICQACIDDKNSYNVEDHMLINCPFHQP